jgi:3-hydroxybutyryl-CoA dehydratase
VAIFSSPKAILPSGIEVNPMSDALYFEQLALGQSWRSPARTVTETDVVNFAGITGDYNPLHIDHEFAGRGPFGRPVAHGLLGLAWVAGLGSTSPRPMTLAFLGIGEWKFLKPVFVGDTLHVLTEVVSLTSQGRRAGAVRWKRRLVNQEGEVVQEGYFETLVSKHAAEPRAERVEQPTDQTAAAETSEVGVS